MDKKKFGSFIKQARLNKGYTQKELADLLYIDVTAVSKWERGVTYPDITLIPDICSSLDINEHELIMSSSDTEYRRIKNDAHNYNKIKNIIFISCSIFYILGIVTCFIANLATSHSLSWFFIVLAGAICGFSFIPTITRFFKKNKLLIFLESSLGAMFILFLTCSIYTRKMWFMIPTISVFLGYFVIFFPIIFKKSLIFQNFSLKYGRFFILIYFISSELILIVLMVFINFYHPIDLLKSFSIILYIFNILIFIGCIKLISKLGLMIRMGIDFLVMIPYLYGLFGLLKVLTGLENDVYTINFSNWRNCSNGNSLFILSLIFATAGIVIIISGILFKHKKSKLQN